MLRNFMMNNTFLRNGKWLFGEFENYYNKPGDFVPYFHFEIAPYRDDFTLYFSKMPSARLYYNSIFLKLWNYNAHDATRYLEAHYALYPDKEEFLQFLNNQLKFRLGKYKKGNRSNFSLISTISLEWVQEKLSKWKEASKINVYNQFIRQDLTLIIKNELNQHPQQPIEATGQAHTIKTEPEQISIEQLTDKICKALQGRLDKMLEDTESKLGTVTAQFERGKIELTNKSMEDKLAILLICLQNLSGKMDRNGKRGDPLFAKMDLSDIAQMLRLHFRQNRELGLNQIQKSIYKLNETLDRTTPAYRNLDKALQKFFFEN